MDAQQVITIISHILTNQNLLGKIFIVIVAAVYTLYAFILNRQINLLSGMVDEVTFSPVLKFLSIFHMIAAVAILLYAAFIL